MEYYIPIQNIYGKNIYGKYLVACHDISFKEKRLFKGKSSVFGLHLFNALH